MNENLQDLYFCRKRPTIFKLVWKEHFADLSAEQQKDVLRTCLFTESAMDNDYGAGLLRFLVVTVRVDQQLWEEIAEAIWHYLLTEANTDNNHWVGYHSLWEQSVELDAALHRVMPPFIQWTAWDNISVH